MSLAWPLRKARYEQTVKPAKQTVKPAKQPREDRRARLMVRPTQLANTPHTHSRNPGGRRQEYVLPPWNSKKEGAEGIFVQ